MGSVNEDGAGIRKRGCSCTKDDFLPEESFQSWGNYARALKETPTRLVDRLFTRSLDSAELEVKSRSHHEMKKTLSWWDLIWFEMGAVIGAGIFVLTGLEAREHAGPAVVLSYVVSGVSALLSVFCYTEFAVEIPVAGIYKSWFGLRYKQQISTKGFNFVCSKICAGVPELDRTHVGKLGFLKCSAKWCQRLRVLTSIRRL